MMLWLKLCFTVNRIRMKGRHRLLLMQKSCYCLMRDYIAARPQLKYFCIKIIRRFPFIAKKIFERRQLANNFFMHQRSVDNPVIPQHFVSNSVMPERPVLTLRAQMIYQYLKKRIDSKRK